VIYQQNNSTRFPTSPNGSSADAPGASGETVDGGHPRYPTRDVDLHVHTRTSSCGYTTHARVLELARAAGRKVVAVTDHDSAAGAVAVRDLAARSGDDVLVLVGMELSTSDFGHVVVFGRGVEDDWGWVKNSPFPRHLPDRWAAIQAHPYRGKIARRDGDLAVEDLPPLPARIDAVEVWNGGDRTKKAPHLNAEYDELSRRYIERNGKVAVASSDGHRPIWVHSFFNRFAQPLDSVDDLVDQLRNGEVEPHAQDAAHLRWCYEGHRRREVIEWHEAGKDWRALAAAGGHDVAAAEEVLATFGRVQALAARGATLAHIAGETGLDVAMAAEYLDIVEEEQHSAAKRAVKVRTPVAV
jgi:predicted metal-dependent phosphoesterase TrpH